MGDLTRTPGGLSAGWMPASGWREAEGKFGAGMLGLPAQGGRSHALRSLRRRLTRYRYNNAPSDVGGRYLYLRDDDTGVFWSPSWQPTRVDLEDYRCRHGLGYTVIGSRRAAIEAETTYLVPLGETLEVWRTRVTNHRDAGVRLSLFSAVEFCLWDAWDDATNFQRNLSTGEVEVLGGVIYHTTEYRERRNHFAYFACSEELAEIGR